jgi:hypothetical protein
MSYLRFNHLAYAEDPIEAEARARRERMAAYDSLPEPLREAVRECDWDIHILMRIGRYVDPEPLVRRVRAISSEREAVAFNAEHAARGGFRR